MEIMDEFELGEMQREERKLREYYYRNMPDENYCEDDRKYLELVQISENTCRIFNTKTGRFHNLELGIDEVF